MVSILHISSSTLLLSHAGDQVSFPNSDDGWEAISPVLSKLRASQLLLSYSAERCVTATFSVRRRKGHPVSREAVGFAFEDHAPFAVEKYHFDFMENGDSVFAVATNAADLKSVQDTLPFDEAPACAPSAILIADGYKSQLAQQPCLLAFEDDGCTHILRYQNKQIHLWKSCTTDPDSISRELGAIWLNSEVPIEHAYLAEDVSEELFAENFQVHALTGDTETTRLQTAKDVASGRSRATINFTTAGQSLIGTLKPVDRSLTAFVIIASLCFVGLGMALTQRASQYQAETDKYLDQQVAIFRRLHPGERVPPAILSRMDNTLFERTSLSGGSGQLPDDPMILRQLRDFLEVFPPNMRLRLDRLQFDNGIIDMDGELRAGGDVVTLRKELQKTGMQVPAPSTTQGSTGVVGFRLNMFPASKEAAQ